MRERFHPALFTAFFLFARPAMGEGEPLETPPKAPEPQRCSTCPPCPVSRTPVHVNDWARLAELTQGDPRVFPMADGYGKKLDNAILVGGIGVTLGGGVALISLVSRMVNGSFTSNTQWSTAAGLGAAALSVLIAWTIAPNRDDFYTVINTWNLRNPTRPLAP